MNADMKNSYLTKGVFATVFTLASIQTYAASPVDFSNLVAQVSPAVVSVNVVKKMTQDIFILVSFFCSIYDFSFIFSNNQVCIFFKRQSNTRSCSS